MKHSSDPISDPMIRETTLESRLLIPVLGKLYLLFEPVAYALLRIVFGVVMLTHGLPKALGTSHGSMMDPMASATNLIQNVMGLPFAPQLAFMVMLLEIIGGVMLAVGLWARPIALMMALELIGISYVHGPTWAWIDRGMEYAVLMAFLAFYIAMRGSGRFALERVFKCAI